jgi:hypothetical protein
MATEDGSLGFAHLDGSIFNLWSRQMCSHVAAAWNQCRVIHLKELLPIQNLKQTIQLIGSVEGGDIIFVNTGIGIYEINIKSQRLKNIRKRDDLCILIPYMSFYHPRGTIYIYIIL